MNKTIRIAGRIIAVSALIVLLPLAGIHYMEPAAALKKALVPGAKTLASTHTITEAQAKMFNSRYGKQYKAGEAVKVYLTRDASGKGLSYALIMKEILDKDNCIHEFVVGFDEARKVKDVVFIELSCRFTYKLNEEIFLKQFKGKTGTILGKQVMGRELDGISKATLSSKLMLDNINLASELIDLAVPGKN